MRSFLRPSTVATDEPLGACMKERAPISPPIALFSETDAARFLGIGRSNLRSLALPRKKLGARRLYHIDDLIEFVDSLPYDGEEDENAETGWEDVA